MDEIDLLRYEKKYDISLIKLQELKSRLMVLLNEDKHNGKSGYKVRSLYFDSVYNGDYFDKEDGLNFRKKIRLRTYNLNSNILKLEIKEKMGENQRKRSLNISREMAERLILGEYDVLKKIYKKTARDIFYIMKTNMYMPKCIVEYDRLAYIKDINNIRITLDTNIKATEGDFNIFSKDICLYPISDRNVLEVKYNNFLLSYIKDILNIADESETAFSKYYNSRNITFL